MTTTPVEWLAPTRFLGAAEQSTFSRLIQLADGRFLAAISSTSGTGVGRPAGSDILGRFYDAAGQPLGNVFRLNIQSTSVDELSAEIVALPGGGFSVVYTRFTLTGFPLLPETDVIVESYDAAGSRISNATLFNGTPGGLQAGAPQIAALSDSRALVIWSDSNDDVRAQIINPQTGANVAGQFEAFNGASGAGEGLAGTALTALTQSNQYLLAMGDRDNGGNDELFFKLISSTGVVGALVTVDDASVDIGTPAVTELTNGRFAITWMREAGGGNDEEVRLRIYNSNGTAHTGVLNPQASASGSQLSPAIAATDGGGLVVFWQDFPTSSLLGQRYDAAGLKVGGVFTVQDLNATQQETLQATRLADGRVALAWVADFSNGGDRDSHFAIWDPRDAANAPDASGIVAGTPGADVIVVAAATAQVFAGRGADSIEIDLTDPAHLTTLDGGSGSDEIRFAAQAGTFDLRPVWVAYNEELEFAGGANLARTVRLEALDVAFLGEIDFDASSGSAEKVVIDMGNEATLNLSGVLMTEFQVGLDGVTVRGDGAAETITGTAEGDTLEGGGGTDTLAGGQGADTVEGGAGADSMTGGNGADTVSYAGATAAVNVNLASQTASGGDAAGDVIAGFEHANGGSGNDALFGNTAGNTLRGNGGNDVLQGAGGADSVDGGAGNDIFWVDDGDIVAGDVITGNTGTNDVLHLLANGAGAGDTVVNAAGATITGIERITFANTLGDSTLFVGSGQIAGLLVLEGFAGLGIDESIEITLDAGQTNLDLTALTLVNWGTANAVAVSGNASNNTLSGTAGVDVMGGDGGNDTLYGGLGGNDFLVGSAGNDLLFGGVGGDDKLYGDAGNDILYGASGNDSLYGGAGNDRLDGDDGNDVLLGGDDNDTVYGSDGNDSLYGGDDNDTLDGEAGNDTLYGDAGNDLLTDEAGNDSLYGGDGNDTILGGAGADTVHGGGYTDTADYTASTAGVTVRIWNGTGLGGDAEGDTLLGIENLTGSGLDDVLVGNDGVGNQILGGLGNDYLVGFSGDDGLYGGDGNDILLGGIGADTLHGGGYTDTADYGASTAGVTVRLTPGTGTGGDAQGDVLLGIENLVGSALDDVLEGRDFEGNQLFGGAGNDSLGGFAGADRLDGGLGNDTLDGGADGDLFVFAAGYGQDRVTLFADGSDKVDLVGLAFADLTETAILGGVRLVITATPATFIDLLGVTTAQVEATDFV